MRKPSPRRIPSTMTPAVRMYPTKNAAGASISEKAYHKTLENVFAHSETTLISFPWLIYHRDTFHEWKEKSPTDIYTMLLDTYLNFSGEKEGMG